MTTTAEATAAPVSVVLGKRTYLISPLRDMDYGFLEKFAQDQFMELAGRSADKVADIEIRKVLYAKAFDAAAKVSFATPEGMQHLATPRGMVMLVWVSLRKEHPDLTIDDVTELLVQEDGAPLLTAAVDRQSKKKKKKKKVIRIPTRRRAPT